MKPCSWWASCPAAWCASACCIGLLIYDSSIPCSAVRRHGDHRPDALFLGPRVVLGLVVDEDPTLHARVAEAAELGARRFVLPGLRGLEPDGNVATRYGVLLEPELRHEVAVDDVLRAE